MPELRVWRCRVMGPRHGEPRADYRVIAETPALADVVLRRILGYSPRVVWVDEGPPKED